MRRWPHPQRMKPALLGGDFPLPLDHPFTYRQAREAGLSRRLLDALVLAGLLRRPLRGVYVAAQAPDTQLLRAQAVGLVVPRGFVVTDESAAWLAGADMVLRPNANREPPPLTVFSTEDHHRLRNGLVASGSRRLLRSDVMTVHGVLVTTPLRTALDLGRLRHRDRAIAALDQLLRLGGFTREDLLAEIERFKGQRGVRQLRYLVRIADGRSESPGESALRLRCHDVGLVNAAPQQDIFDARGRFLGRVDLLVMELRLILEYDGARWHDELDAPYDEKRRTSMEREHYTIRVFRKHNVFGQQQDAHEILAGAAREARLYLSRHLAA